MHAYIDKDGVLYFVINAASRAVDVNQIVCLFRRRLHTMSTDLIEFPVESNANIGGAGSRIEDVEDLEDLKRLNAWFVTPRLPDFTYNTWSPPTHAGDNL